MATVARVALPGLLSYEGRVVERNVCTVEPTEFASGVGLICLAGRKPKCFFINKPNGQSALARHGELWATFILVLPNNHTV
jgi:hypothetical protein